MRSLYTDAEIALIQLGFDTCKENAQPGGPWIDFEEAEVRLDLVLYPPEMNEDSQESDALDEE